VTWILLASLLLIPAAAFGGWGWSRWMRGHALGQQIRQHGPGSHAIKSGTPTMGGLVVLGAWLAAIIPLGLTMGRPASFGFVLASGLGFGALGLLDDILSMRRRHSTGLTALQKIVLGSAVSLGLFFAFRDRILVPQLVPFSPMHFVLPWVGGLFLTWILFLSSTNSANLTDGLDGLAGGVSALVLVGFVILFPSPGNLLLVLPLLGALGGFLWLNVHPADLFMGDVGSFALGGIIGALALANGVALLLPLLAGVFTLEAASVILQVTGLRLTGRRPFRMSPLHHHFEDAPREGVPHWLPACRWPESKATARFLLLQAGFVILAIMASKMYG
jgi:phospho-N-acetylmuramoyl-pentapeptide-transferase